MLEWLKRRQLRRTTIVFDLDGTIADTSGDLIDAANAALVAEGFPQAKAQAIAKSVGSGASAMLWSALAAGGQEADAAQMRRLTERLLDHYDENIAVKTRLFPGFRDCARLLRREGARLALCTNKRERLARKLLEALGADTLFDAVAGGDTFPFQKPDPRHISRVVERAGGELPLTLMVGDSEADVAAAKAAGIPVIAVRFGYASIPLEDLGANALISHFDELPALASALLAIARCA
jgi:phosphoglycolate phosphatase